ncbi:hypothetical protein AVEN_115053-1 [Araneus ventricosus]|uniref:Uncharacterized protein n=1 Tax=Araneus ventricosus TaxID=182803 RepID=A0A4Y1ZYV4_ARAVE|nr:hypothetical protein AVEN_115053-1 [Araneus ventricosus]
MSFTRKEWKGIPVCFGTRPECIGGVLCSLNHKIAASWKPAPWCLSARVSDSGQECSRPDSIEESWCKRLCCTFRLETVVMVQVSS